jgi:hypothetical protein
MRESLGDVRSEKEACSARGKTPTGDIYNPKDFVRFRFADSLREIKELLGISEKMLTIGIRP